MKRYYTNVEMTFEEISRELDIPAPTVRWIYCRAMRKVARACKRFGLSAADIVGRPQHMLASAEEDE